MGGWLKSTRCWLPALVVAGGLVGLPGAQQPPQPGPAQEAQADGATVQKFVTQHCITCHNGDDKRGGLALDAISAADVGKHAATWEKVVRKVVARQMPPPGKKRPDEKAYAAFVAALE